MASSNEAVSVIERLASFVRADHSSEEDLSWLGATQQLQIMLQERSSFYYSLRNARTWDEVREVLGVKGYGLIQSEEHFFAVNMVSGYTFALSECGHSDAFFVERLGPYT